MCLQAYANHVNSQRTAAEQAAAEKTQALAATSNYYSIPGSGDRESSNVITIPPPSDEEAANLNFNAVAEKLIEARVIRENPASRFAQPWINLPDMSKLMPKK